MTTYPPGLLGLLVAGEDAPSADFSCWGERALEHGYDSPSLRILAGLGPQTTWFEAQPYFRRAIDELGIVLPKVDENLRRLYLREVAGQMCSAEISPAEGLERIHRWVLGPLNHPPDLSHWCFLWEGNSPDGYGPISDSARDVLAVAYAKALDPL